MVSRRDFLKGLGATLACLPRVGGAHETAGGKAPPNIVILLADDLGWNDVGYHGSDIRTPRIDAFVKEGVELDRFYACPVCTPTRAGLMTGRFPNRFGLRSGVITPWRKAGLPVEEETMADVLGRAGYKRRACFGKWHLGHHQRAWHPLQRGFTHFYGHYNGAIDFFTHEREGQRDWHRGYEPCDDAGYSTVTPYVDTCSQVQVRVDWGWYNSWYVSFGWYPLYYEPPFYYWDYYWSRPYWYA